MIMPFPNFSLLLGFACLLEFLQATSSIPTISVVGSKFFTSDGAQFFVKGVAYQLTPDDPLVNADQCELDANLMRTLGANAIRVYHVNPGQDHDDCMTAFANAGIYLFLDLDTFSSAIIGQKPAFNDTQFSEFAKVLDHFQQYPNLAGVFVGNEVLTTPSDSLSAPYVKAAAAEIKAYRDRQHYRPIPVGYSAADIATLRPMLQNYLVCGDDEGESIDFFGLNAYEWCGNTVDFQTSGYAGLQKMAEGYPKPIFFSETGCNTIRPRTWADMAAIYGPNMSGTWSGAISYEWAEEANDYGLIAYGPGGPGNAPLSGTPTPITPDFSNLKTAWAKVQPSSVSLKDYSKELSSITTPQCPSYTSGTWELSGNPSLPIGSIGYIPSEVPTSIVMTLNGLSTPTEKSTITLASSSTSDLQTSSDTTDVKGSAMPSQSKKSLASGNTRDKRRYFATAVTRFAIPLILTMALVSICI